MIPQLEPKRGQGPQEIDSQLLVDSTTWELTQQEGLHYL